MKLLAGGARLALPFSRIRVNKVAPDAMPAEVMLKAIGKTRTQFHKVLAAWKTPPLWLNTPEDSAATSIYLAADSASWGVNGVITRVGGMRPR